MVLKKIHFICMAGCSKANPGGYMIELQEKVICISIKVYFNTSEPVSLRHPIQATYEVTRVSLCLQSYMPIPVSGRSRISRRGHRLHRGGIDSRGGYISKILNVETKESGPLGEGACAGYAPRSATGCGT